MLALQGDVREHVQTLGSLGVETRLVRRVSDLEGLDGVVLPGGESTAQSKLLDIFGLFRPLQDAIRSGLPVLATCAGLILLAKDVLGLVEGQKTLAALDVEVSRNAYGSQLDSFEATVDFKGQPLNVAFIRAPRILDARDVEVLACRDSEPVVVRSGRIFAATCHPEITGDSKLHAAFVAACQGNQ